jgi:hypothetical protein
MDQIRAGDDVINPEGGLARVSDVSSVRERAVYRLSFSDKSYSESTANHIWQIRLRNEDSAPWRDASTRQIKTRVDRLSRQARPYLPLVSAVDFASQELPLDPYVLGSLLGNGGLTRQTVTYTSGDPEQLALVQAGLPEGIEIRSRTGSNPYTYGVSQGLKGRTASPLLGALRELDLMGLASHEKFVPDLYKFSCVDTRLAVLRGLMDTDGSSSGGEAFFGTTSPWLAHDVQFLVQSLGGTAAISEKPEGTYRRPDGSEHPAKRYYMLYPAFSPSLNPFLLSRKAEQWSRTWQPSRRVINVEYVGIRPAKGFKLDSGNGLYVAGGFIVTSSRVAVPAAFDEAGC